MKENFVCVNCGSDDLTIEYNNDGARLVCRSCKKKNRWIKTKAELLDALVYITNHGAVGEAFKQFHGDGKNQSVHCSQCNAMLYVVSAPFNGSQFDLAQADYCPNCGARFIKFGGLYG